MIRSILPAACLTLALPLCGDEGMWLFNQPPRQQIREKYGFELSQTFLDHMRSASVRFNNGGSGSFVSPHGLVFTNHHVGIDCIQKISSKENDLIARGFEAKTQAEERSCPDLELNVLLSVEDVTEKVEEGVKPSTPKAEAQRLRSANTARLESECTKATGARCDVVPLFSGGQYHLYRYKKYTDVRLVFAPEFDIAFFGGDPDNFTYPRFNLDVSFFRAYEDGQPAKPAAWFPWSQEGAQENELSFVPGNPGTTGRLATMAELEFARDTAYPLVYRRLASLIATLKGFSARNAENERIARDNLFGQQNSYKAYTGFLSGLRDPNLMNRKREQEGKLRDAVLSDPAKKAEYGNVWNEVAAAYKDYATFAKPYYLYERYATRGSEMLRLGRDLLRYAEEKQKPDADRLKEYHESGLASLEQEMFSPAPIHPAMEIAVLADYFAFLRQEFGTADPTVKAIMKGRTPARAAAAFVNSSKIADVAVRKRIAASAEAARTSTDGMMVLARLLDERARQLRKQYEDRVEAVERSSAARIARARFAVYGSNEYPDATFTLRLAYGATKGYRNSKGETVPWATTFEGLYRRATGKDPYRLPPSWVAAKPAVRLNTPFNFVGTADTHGGNSGSPTINTKGEVIGILFDGNIEGLPNRFLFTDEMARSVHVASQGIIEALRAVYKADRLLAELGATGTGVKRALPSSR
ncbi:MAG TPA: serine protease [Solibacterales bacterium]|nr:serine protease [Bryobacterales bacterium]